MGLLDKLKPQPRWKHADPAVRLEGVRELEDVAELASLAETDPDVKVRRAALSRVDDVDVLARVAAGDPDADLRDRAAERLTAIACRGTEAGGAPDVESMRRAVRALTDPRRLAAVAKSDAPDAVRDEALRLISDPRSLGSIARQARQEGTARAALAKLEDADELVEVTLNAGHKDIAQAAFERLAAGSPDMNTLRAIELRAQHKTVGRRARTMIQELEAAEAARQAAALERQRRESHLVDAVEALGEVGDVPAVKAELARLSDAWQTLGVTEATSLERFSRAVDAANAVIIRREREAEEELERQRVRQEAIATRIALCERVETLDGEDAVAQLVPIEEEWRSLLPLSESGPEADRLADRFARAVAACRSRHEMGATLALSRTALETLVVEAETLPAQEDASAADRWNELSREARALASTLQSASRPAEDLTARLGVVADAFKSREAARKAEVEASREAAVTQLRRLADRARRAAEADTMTLREGERLMRDLAAAIAESNAVEGATELHRAAADLVQWQEKIAPRVRDLREMDEWRKFANAQRQEQLISMAEAIVVSLKADEEAGKTSDLPATAKALRELHAEWQPVAEAPRQNAQRLWDRFRTATDFIRSRCEPFFAKRREERDAARGKRSSIAEEAEALAQSADWAQAATRLQALQAEWQALGHPASDSERELGQRFRAACNTFFVRRREDLADRKKVWTENLSRKEALCERAEALAESTEWDAAATELKRLQADWKTIGPVRKNKSDAVWTRFRAAADRFFERYHHRHEIALAGKLAEREALVIELEALASMAVEATPSDAAEVVQRLRTTWNRAVPIPVPGMKQLTERWQAAFSDLLATRPQLFAGTELDPKAIVTRMEKLVARVEGLVAEPRATSDSKLSPTELLAAKLRTALATNAMGGRGHDESKHRGAVDSAKEALAAWQRLPPVHTPEAEALALRFREACRKIGVGDFRRQANGNDARKDRRPSPPRLAAVEEQQPEPAAV